MCNTIHDKRKAIKIPKKGKGWKLFRISNMVIKTLLTGQPYEVDMFNREWINWNEDWPDHGFCFFLSKKTAKRALETWNLHCGADRVGVMLPIIYREGLIKQIERNFTDGKFMTSLCKSFKVGEIY